MFQSGDDDYDVVPNSQFVVSRTASKDNSSSYAYNGKKATYKEVAALLRGSGIDLDHNRFLILQVRHKTVTYSYQIETHFSCAISPFGLDTHFK